MNNNHNKQSDNTSHADKPETLVKPRSRERTMLIRYGKMGMIGLFKHAEREIPLVDTYVVVNSERGLEIGQIVAGYCHHRGSCAIGDEKIEAYIHASGPNYPLSYEGRFVRYASEDDLNEQRHLDKAGRDKIRYCRELIKKHNLEMTMVEVEHLFGGDRIIFYFMAEGRVDFRSLVKELAGEYQTRIEMRQIGARDEARLIADFETCGRQCCCKNFLKVLQPVNMRMAKMQKATLDPSKISGRCGRLKCCLRYEDQVYAELTKKLPRNNTWVLTEQGLGLVVETQAITQLVKIHLQSGRVIAIDVNEIQERNCKGPPKTESQVESADEAIDAEEGGGSVRQEAAASDTRTEAEPVKKRRRRRRKKKKSPDIEKQE